MIDNLLWALSAAHPEKRPAWIQARMLPAISAKTRQVPKTVKDRSKADRIVVIRGVTPKPFVRVSTSAIPAPRECGPDDTPIAVYQPTIRAIVLETAEIFGVEVINLLSQRRTRNVVIPRQVVMYIATKMTTRSTVFIGKKVGGRDHTTVMSGVKKIKKLMATDAMLAAKIEHIMRLLSEACGEESRAAA